MQVVDERKWPDIAHDIAMLAVPSDGGVKYSAADIARTHGLSMESFSQLLKLPMFKSLLESEIKRIKELGPQAGARIRAEAMAIELQENMFKKAIQNQLDDDLSIKLLGMLLKSSGLEQPPEVVKAQAAAQGNTVNIAFNIPKMNNPKLKHLINQPQVNVVDAED